MKPLKRLLVDLWGRRDDDANWRKDQGPLDPACAGSVLVLHLNDKLGDAVIDSLLLDALAKTHPEIPVSVGTTAGFERYWRAHPHVRDVAVFPPSKGRSALGRVLPARRAARPWRDRFGVVVSFESFAQPDHFALLRALGAKTVVGFDKNRFRLFDHSLEEGRLGVMARPIFLKIAAVMRVFGEAVDPAALRFHVPFGPEDERAAQTVLDRLRTPGPRLFLHAYGTGPRKRLSPEGAVSLLRALRDAGHRGPCWVSVPQGERPRYQAALEGIDDVVVIDPPDDFFHLFALISRMDLVVAPDTSIGHIAAAFRKPQMVLFAGETNVPRVWKPLNDRCAVVVAPQGEGVERIDPAAMLAAARELMGWLDPPTARPGELLD